MDTTTTKPYVARPMTTEQRVAKLESMLLLVVDILREQIAVDKAHNEAFQTLGNAIDVLSDMVLEMRGKD